MTACSALISSKIDKILIESVTRTIYRSIYSVAKIKSTCKLSYSLYTVVHACHQDVIENSNLPPSGLNVCICM